MNIPLFKGGHKGLKSWGGQGNVGSSGESRKADLICLSGPGSILKKNAEKIKGGPSEQNPFSRGRRDLR